MNDQKQPTYYCRKHGERSFEKRLICGDCSNMICVDCGRVLQDRALGNYGKGLAQTYLENHHSLRVLDEMRERYR